MPNFIEILTTFALAWLTLVFVYKIATGLFVDWSVEWVEKKFFKKNWSSLKINPNGPDWREEFEAVRKDIKKASFVRPTLLAFVYTMQQFSWLPGKVYYNISEYGVWYFLATIVGFVIFYDFYFYLFHRVAHIRWFYKNVHFLHHRFHDPVGPVRRAFSPSEIFGNSLADAAFIMVTPVHPLAYIIARTILSYINVLNHWGHETFPSGFTKGRFTKYITTATHHTLHHMYNNSNFSLFINWDIIFGTQYKKYDEFFEKVKSRSESEAVASK